MSHDEFDPFAMMDEEAAEERRLAELRANQRSDECFRLQMSTREGRRFVWGLLAKAGVFWSTYNPKASDIKADMAFAEGRKQTGYELMAQCLRVCPQMYSKMIEESKEDERDNSKPAV